MTNFSVVFCLCKAQQKALFAKNHYFYVMVIKYKITGYTQSLMSQKLNFLFGL